MPGIDYRELSKTDWERSPFPVVQSDFRVFFAQTVFDEIAVKASTTHEVGGILIGNVCQDASGPFLRVDAVIHALHAKEAGTELTITHATWEYIYQEVDESYPGKRMIGWYHTHPNFGIFLSEQDQFIHKNFFDQPYHIALVYDPVRREHGVFVWRENQLWRIRQYWVASSEHLWEGPRDPGRSSPRDVSPGKVEPSAPMKDESWAGILSDLLTVNPLVIVITLMIGLLLGGLLGFGFGNACAVLASPEQIAQTMVQSLNQNLLTIMDLGFGEQLADATDSALRSDLDRAQKALATLGTPDIATAQQSLVDALNLIQKARDERQTARQYINELKTSASKGQANMKTLQTSVIQLYLDSTDTALRGKDTDRARQLLQVAQAIDPENEEVKKRLEALGIPAPATPETH